ncbi:MAG: proprotein convertase P-domain-containing protein [Sandaracinaceae bacterium]
MKRYEILSAVLGAVLALSGCVGSGGVDDPSAKVEDGPGGKEDRWNYRNDPERFDGEFNYHVEDLPTEGTSEQDPWPSSYFPTYEDSINHRWNGTEMSPAEKYDMAFNGWQPSEDFDSLRPFSRRDPVPGDDWDTEYYNSLGPLASHVSGQMGNRRDRDLAVTNSGAPTGDEEWEVETWWGLCHAWVPAAMLEDRPLRPVEYNGVTFEVGDIEALLIAAYNRAPADMIGGRCNAGSGDDEVERDENGRPVDVDCRDTNPGSLHVIATNYLGLQNRMFAMDRTYDYEVWNQPVVGYEITRQEEVTPARAMEILGAEGEEYIYNDDAVTLYDVRMSLDWLTESHASTTPNDTARYTRTDRYHYILEVDGDGKVIGGEYASDSSSRFPDFLWNPRRLTRSSVPYLNLDQVRMLLEMSRGPVTPDPTGDVLTATGGSVEIPDNDATGVSSSASISGEGVITTVGLAIDLTHTYIGDLLITLEHSGVTRTVHNREGGSANDIQRSFDVTGFEGLAAGGDWTVHVSDNAGRDVGSLNSWTLTVGTESGTPVDPGPGGGNRFEGMGGVSIPDNNASGASSTASVAGASQGTVSIEVAITHTYIGDLVVEVQAPNGQSFTLHERDGGSDDDIAETYPLDAVGNRFSDDPNGTWTLRVTDNAGADLGTIDSWAVLVE